MKIIRHSASHLVPVSEQAALAYQFVVLTNPARTEVRDQNNAWLATFTNNCRTVTLKGSTRTFSQQDLPIEDTFNRTRNGTGWGAATRGGTWSLVGGTDPGNYSVTGVEGTVTADTENSSRRAYIGTYDIQDAVTSVRVRTDKLANGANQVASLMFGYQDSNNHYVADLSFIPSLVADTFTRATSSGWGIADSGQTWTTSGGSASDYATTGTTGTHSVGSINVSRRTILTDAVAADFDILVRVKTDALAAGASMTGGIMARYVDSNNHYYFRVRYSSAGSHQIFASVQKTVAGTSTTIGSEVATSLTHIADTYVWIRAQGSGTTLRVKLWQDGNAEPGTWDITTTDTTYTTGAIGMRSVLQTSSTNTLPVLFSYDSLSATMDGRTGDAVELRLRKREAGTNSNLGSAVLITDFVHTAGMYINIKASLSGGILLARAWADGTAEPINWQTTATDATFAAGGVGVRFIANTGTRNLPVIAGFSNFAATGTWTNPPRITHDTWVRVLDTPFNGTVNTSWLTATLRSSQSDILATAMEYVYGAPPVMAGGIQIAGDAAYGPLTASGSRTEGADFNDYLGIPWTYTGIDQPEAAEFKSLDCSGYIRMVWGYRSGMTMRLSAPSSEGGNSIPRVSRDMIDFGPGVTIIQSTGVPPTDLSSMGIGDVVAFDATNEVGEIDGEVDHVGIYMGLDSNGLHRFISSRKSISGPTLSDSGGSSTLNGGGLYGRTFRKVRRF